MVRTRSTRLFATLTSAAVVLAGAQLISRDRAAHADSVQFWNVPIGDGAILAPSGIQPAQYTQFDQVHVIRTTNQDPIRPVIKSGNWLNRCSGTQPAGFNVRIPDNYTLPDARPDYQPNNHMIFIDPDGTTTISLVGSARCTQAGPVYGLWYPSAYKGTITDQRYGTHASQLSALGGTIRPGELTGPQPINHALDLIIWGKENLYWNGNPNNCYRWPALACDAYAGQNDIGYRGTNPQLTMGALLTIPKTTTPEQLGITTDVGRKLLQTLQTYSGYITDDTAWDAYTLGVSAEAVGTFPWGTQEQNDYKTLIQNTHIVTNNSAKLSGGSADNTVPTFPVPSSTVGSSTVPSSTVSSAPCLPAPSIQHLSRRHQSRLVRQCRTPRHQRRTQPAPPLL